MGKTIQGYIDSKGFIGYTHVHWGMEFSKSCRDTGTYYISLFVTEPDKRTENASKLVNIIKLIRIRYKEHGNTDRIQYVRHHDKTRWTGHLWTMDRDNLDPILIAMILYSKYDSKLGSFAQEILKLVWGRMGFAWNFKHDWPLKDDEPKLPDWYLLFLPLIAYGIRLKKRWWLYPFLLLIDLGLVFGSISRFFKALEDPRDTKDDLIHQTRLVFAQLCYLTPVAWFAKLLYKCRPRSGPNRHNRIKASGPYTAYLQHYSNKDAPPMPDVWKPVIDKFL